MKRSFCRLSVCVAVLFVLASLRSEPAPVADRRPQTYGSIEITRVHRIDASCVLFCDIDAFPPVIGQDIPVHLSGVELSEGEAVSSEVVAFFRDVLLAVDDDAPPSIVLRNIRRGDTFSLVADIEVNGSDLAQMLVDQGLARRAIQLVTEPAEQKPKGQAKTKPAQESAQNEEDAYVASTSSRVFHRHDCSHAKRIDASRAVTFQTRQEATQSGRRACKMCTP